MAAISSMRLLVVCGLAAGELAAAQDPRAVAGDQHHAPAAGAGIARAGAVGIGEDLGQGGSGDLFAQEAGTLNSMLSRAVSTRCSVTA